MRYRKQELLRTTKRLEKQQKITPSELLYLRTFDQQKSHHPKIAFLQKIAVPVSLALGFLFSAFPGYFTEASSHLPSWTNFSPPILTGVDYLWDILGEPVKKANILYHIPNIILYSFGFFGIKKLYDAINRRTWLDRVYAARHLADQQIAAGTLNLSLKKGHSILFVGNGDFIGMQFCLNHATDNTITVSDTKPLYTDLWNHYRTETTYEDLKTVLLRSDAKSAGEYIFFPVKDDQIFLPGPTAYDLSPYKLDILCQDIRTIEKEQKWKPRRIIIIGDKEHKSYVHSEDKKGMIQKSGDTISLASIAEKYENVTLLDPTDIVLTRIIALANGRHIVFRATLDGIKEYKTRFYTRLEELGHRHNPKKKGVLTIGYDLFEDQTEQQTLARKIDDYYPVVLSKHVRDALIRNGYKAHEFLYVPDLVLATASQKAAEQ